MHDQANQLSPKHIDPEVIASARAFGLAYSSTYFIAFYFLTLFIPGIGYQQGIFGSSGWLMLLQLVILCFITGFHATEITGYFRVLISIFIKNTCCEAVVDGPESVTSAQIIFEACGLVLVKGSPRFNSMIDKPLMYQSSPVGVIGNVRLKVEAQELVIGHRRLDLVGFDHYRVSMYARPHEDRPHILVRLKGGDRVYAFGDLEGNNEPEKSIILMEARKINSFIISNSIRIIFLASAFCSLLVDFLVR